MLKKIWPSIYILINVSLLVVGFLFEEAYGDRWVLLAVLIILYCVMLVGVSAIKGNLWLRPSLMAGMALVLIVMEFYSKYAVNYFFHSVYVLLIFYSIVQIQLSRAVGLSGLITILSLIKFIQMILISPIFANVALLVFFGSVQILMVVVSLFLKVYQEETSKTKELYRELLEAHDQLKVYSEEIREFTRMEARTKIARDLHDTLGHELTGLIMQMEMAGSRIEAGDSDGGMTLLSASKKSARQSLAKVREIVDTLKTDSRAQEVSIQALVEDFEARTGCRITYIHKGDRPLKSSRQLVLFRVIQESLTNAVRHGKATEVAITVLYGNEEISFEIANNGATSIGILEGNGLKGMRERLKEIGGILHIEGEPEFRLWGQIPYDF